jgi:hypothetical protein
MRRSVLSILAGFVVAIIIGGLLEKAGHAVFPPPEIDVRDPEQLRTAVDKLPLGALLVVLAGWASGSLAGGFVAALIANRDRLVHAIIAAGLQMGTGGILRLGLWTLAYILGGLQTGAEGITLVNVPPPAWFIITKFLVVMPSAWIGAMLANFTRPSTVPSGPQPYDMREKNMAC